MNKKKVLFVTEAHWNPTGYSVYTKEILSELAKNSELELAELACFASPEEVAEHQANVPWRIYCNTPNPQDQVAFNHYNSSPSNRFGEFSFNQVLIHFKPDFVMDIRDYWMMSFEEISFFRPFYKLAWMPTVDAYPQDQSWMNSYVDLDAVFSYSEFGRDTMIMQSPKIKDKFVAVSSPCASDTFYKMDDYSQLRKNMQFPDNAVIFGTVMRNQRRKLYPNLMKAFNMLLKDIESYNNNHEEKLPDVYLYCHTGYPDVGWNIPKLILENEIGHRTILTYQCTNCKNVEISFFNDAVKFCRNCNKYSSNIVGVTNPMPDKYLNEVYNSFDVYIQWANSEGFGMPQLEAARAGLPVVSMYYSAMQSIVDNLEGVGVRPLTLYKELETGCNRAVSDDIALKNAMMDILLSPQKRKSIAHKCMENAYAKYSWKQTAEKWESYFVNAEVPDHSITWNSPPRYFSPAKILPEYVKNLPATDQTTWLFTNVLGMNEWVGKSLWMKVCRDLNYRNTVSSTVPGYYFNDFSHPDHSMEQRYQPFDVDIAFNIFTQLRNMWNQLENMRVNS